MANMGLNTETHSTYIYLWANHTSRTEYNTKAADLFHRENLATLIL